MERASWFYFVVFYAAVSAVASAGLPFVTCKRKYEKAGCFKENKLKVDLLINDRDQKGHELKWNKFKESIHSLACRCAQKAKEGNYKYFVIRYWALCLAGRDVANVASVVRDPSTRSKNCAHYDFNQCKDKSKHECVGKLHTEYLYLFKATKWSKCSKSCGVGFKTHSYLWKWTSDNGTEYIETVREWHACATEPCLAKTRGEWGKWQKCWKSAQGCIKERYVNCIPARRSKRSTIGECTIGGKYYEKQKCSNDECKKKDQDELLALDVQEEDKDGQLALDDQGAPMEM